jgi:type IV pilus assembly protein PilM
MNVLLVAAKKELVEQRMMLLSEAGLKASVVDVDAFALFNVFEYNYPAASKGLVALVNIGHEVASVIVHEDGVPIVTRDIPFGSKHLREDLRRLHGFSSEEAEAVAQGRSKRVDEVEKLLMERGADLAIAIERATAFVSADLGVGGGISAIYLSGGAARMPKIQDALGARMRVRVEVVNPFQRLEIAPEAMAELPGEDAAAMWMLPVGLALRPSA